MRFALSVAAIFALAPIVSAQDPKAPALPRRVLFVHVGGYLYLNPLTHSAPGGPDRVRAVADRFAAGLRTPTARGNDQLFVLADTLTTDARLPTKDVLAKALEGFCTTTRPQDRVVIYFGVHAVEKDGKAFVVPIDGAPDAPETLLPVADVYAALKGLNAAQKVVIWDVCRHNPERVRGRRDPGPMTDALFKALTAPPEGVQALVSCSPGERSLEYSAPRGPAGIFAGSAYLDALRHAAADTSAKAAPGDAIPVEALHKSACQSVATLGKQTPTFTGTVPKQSAAHDPKAAPAKRFELAAISKGTPSADVKTILDELALPPLFEDDAGSVALLPFAEASLKSYEPDVSVDEALKNGDKYPLRVATLRALQAVRDTWPLTAKEPRGVTPLVAPVVDRTKKAISDAQLPLAQAITKLEVELEGLLAATPNRAKETKRWQAHYDYTVAEVRLRLVVLNEYNVLLARVRTESLPDLPSGATGWRLCPAEKLTSRREVRDLFNAAQEGFTKLATDHRGTPWDVLAKRSRAFVPGLRWEVVVPLKVDEK